MRKNYSANILVTFLCSLLNYGLYPKICMPLINFVLILAKPAYLTRTWTIDLSYPSCTRPIKCLKNKLWRSVLERFLNMVLIGKLDSKINRMVELCTVHTPVFAHSHNIDLCYVLLTRSPINDVRTN